MTTTQKIESTRAKLQEIGEHKQDLYHAYEAAKVVHAEIRQRIMNGITGIGVERQFYTATIFSIAQSAPGFDFGSVSAIISAMESDPEISEAIAQVGPIMAELAELEATHAAEQHEIALAEVSKREQLDAARAAAVAEVESRFAEPEPTAPTEPPKPFRGRVKITSDQPELAEV